MFCFCLMSVVHTQTVVLDISKSKLPQGIFLRKDFHFINGDTVYKKFERYTTVIEQGDSVLYLEQFDVNRSWIVSRFLISGKEQLLAGWQTEYDINGYKLFIQFIKTNFETL